MKPYDWSDEKNGWLRQVRGITFEDIVFHLAHGGLLDTIEHPNQRKYPGQRTFIVEVEGYACLVPFVEGDEVIFFKTIIPGRKMIKLYMGIHFTQLGPAGCGPLGRFHIFAATDGVGLSQMDNHETLFGR